MNWRFSTATFLICAIFATVTSSPAGKKGLAETTKDPVEKNINPSNSEAEDDDLLARTKKSSTTTFCVEIKPGNDQPQVVVCDGSKQDQQIPIHSAPIPQTEPTIYTIPSSIPNIISGYPQEIPPQPSLSYEPLIFIPQQPQIFSPFVQPSFPLQPQIIIIRDPSCPTNNPFLISSLTTPNLVFPSKTFGKSSLYGMESEDLWKSGYGSDEEALRSNSGSQVGGLFSNGLVNPSKLIYPKQGPFQQNPAILNGNHISEGILDRPVLIQCNPTITPLSQGAYATAVASGKANDMTSNGMMGGMGAPQFTNLPGALGIPTARESTPHHHHHQANMYQQDKPYNMQQKMMPGYGFQGRANGVAQSVKGGQEMTVQKDRAMPEPFAKTLSGEQLARRIQQDSLSSLNAQGDRQGVPAGDGRSLSSQVVQQEKMGSEKLMEGAENSGTSFESASFGQGQNGFVNRDRIQGSDSKDQGLQRQMGFAQHQQQQQQHQQIIPGNSRAAGLEQNLPQQQRSYSQMLLERMRSAVGQGNMVQPYMASSLNSEGGKQTESKS